MRHYQSMRISPFVAANLRGELRKIDMWARLASTQFGRTIVQPQGTPSGGLGQGLGDYLFLPGRQNGQISYGRVRFQAKSMPAGGASVPDTAQTGFGLQSTLTADGLTNVNFWIESQAVNLTTNPSREWVIPAFNEVEGDTTGLHYFVDAATHQSMTLKTFRSCRYVAGTTSGEGWLDNSESRYFHWSMENMPSNRNASTHANLANTPRPVIQVSPLDAQLGLAGIDNSHTMPVVKVPRGTGSTSTATPFEIAGLLYGGDTQREVYAMPGASKLLYTLAQGDLATWNPATSFTGDVNFSTTIINIASTANMRPGQRIRDTRSGQAYVERFISRILTTNQIEVDVAFSENTVGIAFVAHGATWTAPSALAGIDHQSLSNLVWPIDDHTQYLNIFGRAGGQIVGIHGGGFVHTNAATEDVIVHGTVGADPFDTNFALNATGARAFHGQVRPTGGSIGGGCLQLVYDAGSQTTGGTGGVAQYLMLGTYGGSTAATLRGLVFTASTAVGSGNITELTAALLTNAPAVSGGAVGVFSGIWGIRVSSSAPSANATIANGLTGLEILMGPKGLAGKFAHITLSSVSGGAASNAVTDWWGILFGTIGAGAVAQFDTATIANWTCIEIPDRPVNPTGTIRGLKVGDILSHHVGQFQFGSTANAAHMADFAAGTTGLAPIRLAAGTNLTAAAAGCVEYDGTDLMFTHGDTVRTKITTQRGAVNATAQAAAIGATTLYAAPAAGYYVFHYTLEVTTADATAGTIQVQVNYMDDVGATNQTGVALVLTATGRDRGSFQVYANAAQNIQYQTNVTGAVNAARYALRVRLVYLG